MLNFLRKIFPDRSPLRLFYHKISAILAAIFFRFPAEKLKIIAITGTSGKSTTVELAHFLLQNSGKKCGAISTIQIRVGEKILPNNSLRTTLSPWQTQKFLRQMVRENCEFCVLEISSHALDQSRIFGVNVDTAVLTNIFENEHLDYHQNFAEYLKTKLSLFKKMNAAMRKPGVKKTIILPRDDEQFEIFDECAADQKWTFSRQKNSDLRAENEKFFSKKIEFDLQIPNQKVKISAPLVGPHNLENLLAAISIAVQHKISLFKIAKILPDFPGAPGRMETINENQNFSVIVDFSYKPSALSATLQILKKIAKNKIFVIFGGAENRTRQNLEMCGEILDKFADEIILTTDDPGFDNPRKIAEILRKKIGRRETENFFEIEDRFEAIRFAIFTAAPGDIILIAGRGHEKFQKIKNFRIPFDDREVARKILRSAENFL